MSFGNAIQDDFNLWINFFCIFSGDVEEMRKKYEAEQEKANILEGKVASLESQLHQHQEQKVGIYDTSDSDDDIY